MFSLAKFIASKTGRMIMSRCYGIGAALVIIGALFKIQHWQGAGWMLSIGMITECVIFFLSAFEPLPVEYHWETVYPELAGDNLNLEDKKNISAAKRLTQTTDVDLNIDSDAADKLKKNVEHLNSTLNSLSALSTIGEAAQQFTSGIQQAAGNLNTLNETTQTVATTYREAAQSIANTYCETTQTIANSGRQANENMATLNKNLQAVNTSYELYLQEHKSYVEQSKVLINTMDTSAQQAQQFDQQMMTLNKLIAELNTTYTAMVHTVNTTLKKK